MSISSISRLFSIGEATPDMIISWAESQLIEGQYTDHLAVVAGYSVELVAESQGEFYMDFVNAIEELGHSFTPTPPSEQQAVLVCEAYLEGDISAEKALILLYELWRYMAYHVEDGAGDKIQPFMYLSDTLVYLEEAEGDLCLVDRFSGISLSNWKVYFDREVKDFLRYHHRDS